MNKASWKIAGYLFCGMFCLGLGVAIAADGVQAVIQPMTKEQQEKLTPKNALDMLKKGNARFVNGSMKPYDYSAKREVSAGSQSPLAVVLACLDSRSIPELVFDQGLGNIFVARVAGNVVNEDILGSEEFATELSGAKVIVVMGHTSCGAVRGACVGAGSGNLLALLNKIKPAVDSVAENRKKSCSEAAFIDKAARENVINQVRLTYDGSSVIKKLVDDKRVILVGAMHDLATGKVDFFYEFIPAKIKEQ